MQYLYHSLIALILFFIITFQSVAQNANYVQRRQDYINTALNAASGAKLVMQAGQGVPLDATTLQNKLNDIPTNTVADFSIVEMVRILFLTNGEYDNQILPVLNSVPYWINNYDTVRNYWSENHMIMWMSSDWLLHEKYGRPVDANLEARLKHYLDLKNNYGFYEFFSSVYAPYCFRGLVNLADFAQDSTIKAGATLASQNLLKEFLLLTNNQGVFFPAAGRNYEGKYSSPYGQEHNDLIYLLTGMGDVPPDGGGAGAFLATSTIPVDDVINSWQPVVDMMLPIGHTLQEGFALNSGMTTVDKTVFQWSSGAYFHPDVVLQTTALLQDSNMWRHVDFTLLGSFAGMPQSTIQYFANQLTCISQSSVICGQTVAVYKHNSITLSSIQDFWKGKVGFQQHPCVANVGRSAIYPASGIVYADWEDRSENTANSHLPYVEQHSNKALLMYWPEPTDPVFGPDITAKDVSLRWPANEFDEVAEDDLWLLGRQDENYVAVRRYCNQQINGQNACPTIDKQAWVIMMGDSGLYGDFENFKDIIHQSVFTENWTYDSLTTEASYTASIILDGDTIDYTWNRGGLQVGIAEQTSGAELKLYPNPAQTIVNLQLPAINGNCVVEMYSLDGRKVFSNTSNSGTLQIPVSSFSQGLYTVKVVLPNGKMLVKKLMVG